VWMHTRSYVHIFIVTTTSAKSINTIALLETTKLGSNFPSPFSVSTSGGFFSVRPLGYQGTAIVGSTVDPPRKIAQNFACRLSLLQLTYVSKNASTKSSLNRQKSLLSSVRQDENKRHRSSEWSGHYRIPHTKDAETCRT
jgi:hypothetical protein